MTPHKHAEVIKAWANGATIEARHLGAGGSWSSWRAFQDGETPHWNLPIEFRVKPEKVYPETQMTAEELSNVVSRLVFVMSVSGADIGHQERRAIANAALRHAIDSGQVVMPGGQ